MERTAFARARAFLDFSPQAKRIAILAGLASAIFYVLLVLVLALFVDLLVSRGRIPYFAQLNPAEQERFQETWKNLPEADRQKALEPLGFGSETKITPELVPGATPDEKYQNLLSTESDPPLPASASAKALQEWRPSRRPGENVYLQAVTIYDVRWRAYVRWYLQEHIGADAAESYQPRVASTQDLPIPGLGEDSRQPHGVLSLVIRLRGTTAGKILNVFVSWAAWTYGGGDSKDPNRAYLTGLLILGLFLAFCRTACIIVTNLMAAKATIEAVTKLRRAVYHHSTRTELQSFSTNGSGPTQGMFTRHIESIHDALYVWLSLAFRNPAQFVLLLLLAILIHPWLTIVFAVLGLLVWLIGSQIAAIFRHRGRVASRNASTRLILLLESLRLVKLVKSYLMEGFNQNRVERQLSEYSKAHLKRYRGEAFGKPLLVLFVLLPAVGLMYVAGRIALTDGLSIGGLTILTVAFGGLYYPIKQRLEFKKVWKRGRESALALFEFLDQKGGGDQSQFADAEFLPAMRNSIELREITLREPGSSKVLLKDVTLNIQAGTRIGIVGPDERAKQALLSLFSRFVDPSDGEVRVDGRNIRWVTHESLRAQIGLITQDRLIFNDTIVNNIGCGDPSFTTPQIIEAAKLAHAHQFIQKLPYGYETPIGELGHSLRTGEQYRIALARAILRDPAIYIIEEPLVPLDDDTKDLLDDTLDRVLPGKTAIFLPHRVSTIRHCDHLILVNEGKIEAVGTHKELVGNSPLYKHLYYLEFNEFAEQT